MTYPVLLDPGSKVHKEFEVEGIPKSFVFDRDGKLVSHLAATVARPYPPRYSQRTIFMFILFSCRVPIPICGC